MFSKCANPECSNSFDYTKGRLIRFPPSRPEGKSQKKSRFVRHFWLCNECAETYTLEQLKGAGVVVVRRFERSASKLVLRPVGVTAM